MPQTLGERNNNYLNVKNGAAPWMDKDGKDSGTDGRGHAVFKDPAYGVRAGILTLRAYFFKHQLRTIAQILARWAPVTDTIGSLPGAPRNSPIEYSTFVAGRMGISYNQKLDIFDEDKSIGNLSRLRQLFFAMAAFENGGGFQVPEADFAAGVRLLEPEIDLLGTESNDSGAESTLGLALESANWAIGASVGRWNKGAVNAKSDVETVQRMLRNAAMILGEPRLDPGATDGEISQDSTSSRTISAIVAFQSRFFVNPDGLIEANGRTWRELLAALSGTGGVAVPPAAAPCFFPFTALPAADWTNAPRSFGARRDGGARAHAGCDLYFPAGTTIHAISDGTVVRGPYPFYAETFALEIDHGSFLARYGEIQERALVSEGDRVVAGQPIAMVGHLVGIPVPSDMLHLELYDKSAHGALTVAAAQSARTAAGVPFLRRKDLIDPTPKLDIWKANLPTEARRPGFALGAGAITQSGFCLHLKRIRQEKRASRSFSRTVGEYQCYWDGAPLNALKGQMVERGGPGDNTTEIGNNRDLRIAPGVYRLSIHHGTKYKTFGYSSNETPDGSPKPGLLLRDTDERTAILIHPGNDYVSSIGCLNPASGLVNRDSEIDFADSRKRVIAIIEGMKAKMGSSFPSSGGIPEAVIVIEGDPV